MDTALESEWLQALLWLAVGAGLAVVISGLFRLLRARKQRRYQLELEQRRGAGDDLKQRPDDRSGTGT